MKDIAEIAESAVAHMTEDHADAVALYARVLAGEKSDGWSLCGIDAGGFDLSRGDALRRVEFDAPLQSAEDLRKELARLARLARQKQADAAS